MDNYKCFETTIGGKKVTVEIGKYAFQTNGHCIVRCGETAVMVNVCMNKLPRDGQDFFPLSVDYDEKLYAVGKIPGGFKRREGRPTDQAILTSRLIDRPLRPLFPKGFFNDVTVVATPLSVDYDNAPEPLAMFGSSIALTISDIPFAGPTGSCEVALIDGKYYINPTTDQKDLSSIELKVAGTKDAILMVEAGAKQVSEEEMLQAILFAHEEIKKQVAFQEKIAKELNVKKAEDLPYYVIDEELEKDVREFSYPLMTKVMEHFNREERNVAEEDANVQILEHFADKYPDNKREIFDVLYKMEKTASDWRLPLCLNSI